MKFYTTWITVVAILAIALPEASAQIENTIISRRSGISSTLSSFNNNIRNKINEYNSKIISLKNDMSSQLSSAMQTITPFIVDADIGTNAVAASDVLSAAITVLSSVQSAFISGTSSVFTSVNTCLSNKTTVAINATFVSLASSNSQMSVTLSTSGSTYASTCRGKYSNIPNDLVNQVADRVQECLNNENNQQSRINSILNNYLTMVRQNYQGLTNHVRYCSSLGSVGSRIEVKKQISACFKGISIYVAPIYKATLEQQITFVSVMLQLEAVASNNRVKECINQVTETYNAMSAAFAPTIDACLLNGQ
ncbi:uncharacterized protein LOC126568974 [Anopheles aquasalis]|uniref:uncharacterized protein LOC126568974 n=1 Tax=Anopheles aquasalis TaxID=42839 RepID=UPI00215A90F1|nr:uncharacterized protein LOC126568974 [Anopheles aquasalis]XP_050081667.1 uncharacterized protein LOC126568974 [Anopheles aquasalis]